MDIPQRIAALRKLMACENMQAYVIVTDDFHGSEYVGEYFKSRVFMSGFTGSAGTLVVLRERAALWTDGRYFLQAENQLAGTGIELMKMGEEGVPTIAKFLVSELNDNDVIGFDGRTVSNRFATQIADEVKSKNIRFSYDKDLVDAIWTERPEMSARPVWELDTAYAGKSREEKIVEVRKAMERNKADFFLVTALDEIAWLLNLRGDDVAYTPVFLAYMLIGMDSATLYIREKIIPGDIKRKLDECNVTLASYERVYEDIAHIPGGKRVMLDGNSANYRIVQSVSSGANGEKPEILNLTSPVIAMKAIKNAAEMENIRRAHIKDGVAVTRFIYWLKKNVRGNNEVTELEAAARLDDFRTEMEHYMEQSFSPIMAYGEHGAIVHYDPMESTGENNGRMEARGFCLADTGGHYLEGTTDITRTVALGELTEEEKRMFTLVLRGHLNLGAARFPYGVCGANLDALAREPLWENGLDYNHGTGHGVGYLMNVHEGPQRFAWKINGEIQNAVLEEGMVISDEPGVYLAGKFGIRHENLVLVRKGEKTEYGQFMYLEPLTLVPFDVEAVEPSLMTDRELELLNAYHKKVYETIAPFLSGEESAWLKECTQPIEKR